MEAILVSHIHTTCLSPLYRVLSFCQFFYSRPPRYGTVISVTCPTKSECWQTGQKIKKNHHYFFNWFYLIGNSSILLLMSNYTVTEQQMCTSADVNSWVMNIKGDCSNNSRLQWFYFCVNQCHQSVNRNSKINSLNRNWHMTPVCR